MGINYKENNQWKEVKVKVGDNIPVGAEMDYDGSTIPVGWEEVNYFNNAGYHNSIYRGKDITDLFYNGTLSTQIANGTFDDIFIGDYIIGQVSGRKYLVADINYRLHTGDTETTTNHILMIPEKIMGTAKMNDSNTTTGAYVGSKMYTTNLSSYRTIINNDFGSSHILTHRNLFKNAVTGTYESGLEWKDSTVDLMSEKMIYGCDIFHNRRNGTNYFANQDMDNTQLALFRLRADLIVAFNDNNERVIWWTRDVASSEDFCAVTYQRYAGSTSSSISAGVRPAFLIY